MLIYHLLILNFLISLLSLIIIRLYSLSIHSWKQYNNSKDRQMKMSHKSIFSMKEVEFKNSIRYSITSFSKLHGFFKNIYYQIWKWIIKLVNILWRNYISIKERKRNIWNNKKNNYYINNIHFAVINSIKLLYWINIFN